MHETWKDLFTDLGDAEKYPAEPCPFKSKKLLKCEGEKMKNEKIKKVCVFRSVDFYFEDARDYTPKLRRDRVTLIYPFSETEIIDILKDAFNNTPIIIVGVDMDSVEDVKKIVEMPVSKFIEWGKVFKCNC